MIHDLWYAKNIPNTVLEEKCPDQDANTTMLHCLHDVPFHALSVSPKALFYFNQSTHFVKKYIQLMYSFNLYVFSTCVFFNRGTLRGIFENRLASHRRLLTLIALTGNSTQHPVGDH